MMRPLSIALLGIVVSVLLVSAAPAPKRHKHPDTVAHCLVGEIGAGRVSHFEPCQNRERYGRI